MRIAIVGPTHPYKGGIAQHTTELAHHLTAAGHDVEVISWRTQYPFFYPGKQFVPDDQPELPEHAGSKRVLSWKNPTGWARWGRHLRQFDQLIFVWWVPTIQGPVYLGMLGALGKKRPPAAIICHNVLPHEPKPGDRQLARAVLGQCQSIIVHGASQAALARQLSSKPVHVLNLPLSAAKLTRDTIKKRRAGELLFFGFVRPYKGVDILLRALAEVPAAKLTIAGEFWGGDRAYNRLADELGLHDRVAIHNGYVAAGDLADLICAADAVVLPYKEGTASWNVSLAHAYGTPVIATTAGSLGSQVRDGIDGLLCEPNNVASLAAAIRRLCQPGMADRLRAGIPQLSTDEDWQLYVEALAKG